MKTPTLAKQYFKSQEDTKITTTTQRANCLTTQKYNQLKDNAQNHLLCNMHQGKQRIGQTLTQTIQLESSPDCKQQRRNASQQISKNRKTSSIAINTQPRALASLQNLQKYIAYGKNRGWISLIENQSSVTGSNSSHQQTITFNTRKHQNQTIQTKWFCKRQKRNSPTAKKSLKMHQELLSCCQKRSEFYPALNILIIYQKLTQNKNEIHQNESRQHDSTRNSNKSAKIAKLELIKPGLSTNSSNVVVIWCDSMLTCQDLIITCCDFVMT